MGRTRNAPWQRGQRAAQTPLLHNGEETLPAGNVAPGYVARRNKMSNCQERPPDERSLSLYIYLMPKRGAVLRASERKRLEAARVDSLFCWRRESRQDTGKTLQPFPVLTLGSSGRRQGPSDANASFVRLFAPREERVMLVSNAVVAAVRIV